MPWIKLGMALYSTRSTGKGFTAEHFQHLYVFLQAAVPQLWALLTDCDTDMNVSTSMMYPFLSQLTSSEGVRRQRLCPNKARCSATFLNLRLFGQGGGGGGMS